MTELYLEPGRIGRLPIRNRLVRAATSDTMAGPGGEVSDAALKLYGDLAAGGAGLIFTGHLYVEPAGQYSPRQTGIDADRSIAGLARLVKTVHDAGGIIFAELSHAGSQSMMPTVEPVAPSVIANAISTRQPVELSEDGIQRIVAAFGAAARRAMAAGFDGIHIHGGNGYLISQFSSPVSNRREDGWGGDAQRRSRFFLAVYDSVRAAVGPDVPVTARLAVADSIPDGLEVKEGVERAGLLAARGLAAVEATYGWMASYLENVRPYVGVGLARALKDWAFPRIWTRASAETYYRPFAHAIKSAVDIPVILVGGVRSTDVMNEVLRSGDADFLAFARPFIREPDFPKQLTAGRRGAVECVSCNICLHHDGVDPLKCWRKNPADLARHALYHFRRHQDSA
jgi:2,4-dienoyl-CoA reductase-like NADH-dependent reductase (Old Yellow Enzyme family)